MASITPGDVNGSQQTNQFGLRSTASPSTLAGEGDPQSTSSQPSTGGDGLSEIKQKIGNTIADVMEWTKQFPASAKDGQQALKGLRAMLQTIIANPGNSEPPAPQIGG